MRVHRRYYALLLVGEKQSGPCLAAVGKCVQWCDGMCNGRINGADQRVFPTLSQTWLANDEARAKAADTFQAPPWRYKTCHFQNGAPARFWQRPLWNHTSRNTRRREWGSGSILVVILKIYSLRLADSKELWVGWEKMISVVIAPLHGDRAKILGHGLFGGF